ncbi:MAG: type I secretion system permease/ATPase [Pseudomonadota bacterium]
MPRATGIDRSAEPADDGVWRDAADPLMACLEKLALAHGKPFSEAAIRAGLPTTGALSIDLFARAARRVGLKAKLMRRPVSRVPSIVAPFVVLLRTGDAGLVLGTDASSNKVQVVFPDVSDEPLSVSMVDLERDSSGYVFYVTPETEAATATTGTEPKRQSHWLWPAVFRFWPSWVQVLIAALLINVLALATPLFIMNVYDRVIPNLAIPTLWALAAGVALAILFDFVLKQVRAFVLDRTSRRVDMSVGSSIFEHALSLPMAKRPVTVGGLANQIREFESVREFFTSTSVVAITDFLFIGLFILVLWLIVGPLAFVPLIAVPVVIGITLIAQIPLTRSVRKTQEKAARRHSVLVEALTGAETIKTVGGEAVMQRRFEDAIASAARTDSTTKFWSTLTVNATALVQQVVSVVTIVWGVFLIVDGQISIGALIAASILSSRVLAPLGSIAQTMMRAQQAFEAVRGLNQVMGIEGEQTHTVRSGRQVTAGDIVFDRVSFTYPGSTVPALSELSLTVNAGEAVGLAGRIGSGKTTIGKLLAGLYEPDSGRILIDGIDSRQYEPAELRRAIGFLPQEPELFAGTLRDNIRLGRPDASEDEIMQAATLAGVTIFSDTHPLGLNLPIGERGRGLSGGQRQAVSLARLLLRTPRVLFLDEPSSAMDGGFEAALVDRLRDYLTEDRTLIVCAHRGAVTDLVDRLVVLDKGRVAGDGPKGAVVKALRDHKAKNAAGGQAS